MLPIQHPRQISVKQTIDGLFFEVNYYNYFQLLNKKEIVWIDIISASAVKTRLSF